MPLDSNDHQHLYGLHLRKSTPSTASLYHIIATTDTFAITVEMVNFATGLTNLQPESPFVNLAPEIRNRIYDYAFTAPTTKYGSTKLYEGDYTPIFKDDAMIPSVRNRRGNRPHSVLALLQTCRFIYQEAALLFYSNNNIEIGYSDLRGRYPANSLIRAHHEWVRALNRGQRHAVRDMTLRLRKNTNVRAFLMFTITVPRLRKVTIAVDINTAASFTTGKEHANRFFRHVGEFKEGKGLEIVVVQVEDTAVSRVVEDFERLIKEA